MVRCPPQVIGLNVPSAREVDSPIETAPSFYALSPRAFPPMRNLPRVFSMHFRTNGGGHFYLSQKKEKSPTHTGGWPGHLRGHRRLSLIT